MSKMVKVQQFDLESTDLKVRPPWAPSLALSIVSCVSLGCPFPSLIFWGPSFVLEIPQKLCLLILTARLMEVEAFPFHNDDTEPLGSDVTPSFPPSPSLPLSSPFLNHSHFFF